jgi:2-polyprenyl-6-hydroxyphenyl methylase/3-demethylubiquinone-9 3-methyltransferase
MREVTRTDSATSIESSEYCWDVDGPAEAHDYLLNPVRELLQEYRAKQVLDLGCGNGSFAARLAGDGFDVTGVDFSQSGIERAGRNHPGLRFAQHDLLQPLDESYAARFDAVVSTEVIEHLLLPRSVMQNAQRALRPGGHLIVTTPHHGYVKNLLLALTNGFDSHWHPLRDYGHIKFFSRATLTQLFREAGFVDIRFRTAGRFPPLGKSMVVAGRLPS